MPQPPAYTIATDFSADEAGSLSGRSTVRTTNLDTELINLKAFVDQMRTNVALSQADDGSPKDDWVDLASLADDVITWVSTNGNGWYATDTGTVNTMVVTLDPAATTLANGMFVVTDIKLTNTSTAVTLNVNGLGAKVVVTDGAGAVPAIGALTIGTFYGFQYDLSADKFQTVFSGDSITHSAAASVSAAAAATSATAAAASYDSFDDRYLGTKSSDPSVDNDGATLLDGALYFNTSTNVMMVYDLGGTAWNRTTPTSADQTKINTVSGIASDVTAVAAKATEIGRLGTADEVADMAILGTSDVVTDMNVLGTADVVTDMNVLGTADVVADMNTLAVSDVITDMNTLGTADVVADMNVLGTADVVTDMNVLATADVVTDMNVLGTADVVSDMNTLGTSANVTAMDTCSGSIANINTTATNIANVNLVGTNITGVNSFADRYRVASSAPASSLTQGDLYFNTTTNEMSSYGTSWQAVAISAANQVNINIVAGDIVYSEDLGSIADAITTSTGSDISTVADSIADINALAPAAVIADMALLGESAVIADMALLGDSAVITDMALLGLSAVITDMALLAVPAVITDMDLLGATGVIGDIETVADSIANVNRYAAEYVINSSTPTSPTPAEGDLWYDSTNNVLKYHNGTGFVSIASGIADLVSDGSPQLGAALDCQNNNINNCGTISGANLQMDFGGL